jgi:hypothetical protein
MCDGTLGHKIGITYLSHCETLGPLGVRSDFARSTGRSIIYTCIGCASLEFPPLEK